MNPILVFSSILFSIWMWAFSVYGMCKYFLGW